MNYAIRFFLSLIIGAVAFLGSGALQAANSVSIKAGLKTYAFNVTDTLVQCDDGSSFSLQELSQQLPPHGSGIELFYLARAAAIQAGRVKPDIHNIVILQQQGESLVVSACKFMGRMVSFVFFIWFMSGVATAVYMYNTVDVPCYINYLENVCDVFSPHFANCARSAYSFCKLKLQINNFLTALFG